MCVFMCRNSVNSIWLIFWVCAFCGVCLWLCTCVCVCVYLCGYECVQECMRALWQVYSPLFVWEGEILSTRSLCTVRAKPEPLNLQTSVKNSDDSVFSFLASAMHIWLHNYVSFFSLASLMWLSKSSTRIDSVSRSSWQSLPELDWFN